MPGDLLSQPLRYSMGAVGLDFGLGSAVSLGMQAMLFPTFPLPQDLAFTGIVCLLALARRYGLRRDFNWLVRQGQRQSWRMPLVEAVPDAWCAIAIAYGLLAFWYPDEALRRVDGFVGRSCVLTPRWQFMLRRLFEWLPGTGPGWRRAGRHAGSVRQAS
jgi:hypothetical protein